MLAPKRQKDLSDLLLQATDTQQRHGHFRVNTERTSLRHETSLGCKTSKNASFPDTFAPSGQTTAKSDEEVYQKDDHDNQ